MLLFNDLVRKFGFVAFGYAPNTSPCGCPSSEGYWCRTLYGKRDWEGMCLHWESQADVARLKARRLWDKFR